MGKIIPLPRSPQTWSDREREVFSRLKRFYNRCNLVDAFVEITEGHTDEGEPWISFARRGGDVIMSIAKTLAGSHAGYIVQHRSRIGMIEDLEEFIGEITVDEIMRESGTRR